MSVSLLEFLQRFITFANMRMDILETKKELKIIYGSQMLAKNHR